MVVGGVVRRSCGWIGVQLCWVLFCSCVEVVACHGIYLIHAMLGHEGGTLYVRGKEMYL